MADTCAICNELEPDLALLTDCSACGRLFHLNPYQTPGKDCGDAWMGDEPTLQFFCTDCLQQYGLVPPALEPAQAPMNPLAAAAMLFEEGEDASILESMMAPSEQASSADAQSESPPRLAPRAPSTRRYRRVDR